ncbi:ESX secretion-associated protein EspG [Nocardia sp. SYP-A9097]|uniref:ESX secretion-associated protein EspG n=1 Tax=Nocardia sp. SYP-A9097 TaxID=2663237 RepID=UPI00189182AD|nr:ESX secretion-associated protein EspG [Nocardia sp. SYP-A9097]
MWQFTEAEFYVLWKDRAGEEPPEPFTFTSATRTAADFQKELREARDSLGHKLKSTDLESAFEALANPDLYLTTYGWSEADLWGTNSQVRVLATRKGPKGYVITQLPGATYWRRGGYTMVECDPIRLADAVVDATPTVERGSRGDITLATRDQDLDHDYGRSAVAAGPDTAVSKTKEFLTAPATTAGDIYIVQGSSVFGPRGITRHLVRYRDLAEDGRYVITENPEQALAVDESRFISVINNYIAAIIRAIKDERG